MSFHPTTPRRITAGRRQDADGKPVAYTLSCGDEVVALDPGKSWIRVDIYKWVTRGLIEAPQSFHVEGDGTVDVNGEKIALADPEGLARLDHEINKSHQLILNRPGTAAAPTRPARAAEAHPPDRVHFKVKVDQLGHLFIECFRAGERTETGMKGLPSLAQHGLMRKPLEYHVDPLQRYLELDGARYECSEDGARQLEATLNARYAPAVGEVGHSAIEIRENLASATGFDIRFIANQAGFQLEVKGHLNQERLDILQDSAKCDLLRPGILLKISPPKLLVRRRRPDGGEEPIPEFPDLEYRRSTEAQLQQLFNHPLLRRRGGGPAAPVEAAEAKPAPRVVALRLRPHPSSKILLWLESVTDRGEVAEGLAFTHHNVAELQHRGLFQDGTEATLALDNRTLTLHYREANRHETVVVGPDSNPADLERASVLLTTALRPLPAPAPSPDTQAFPAAPTAPPVEGPPEPQVPVPPVLEASAVTSESPPAAPASAPPAESGPSPVGPLGIQASGEPDGAIAELAEEARAAVLTAEPTPPNAEEVVSSAGTDGAEAAGVVAEAVSPEAFPSAAEAGGAELFPETDPLQVNVGIFERLAASLGVPRQEVHLSLAHVFENRRFEVLCFNDWEVWSLGDLRHDSFHGFYLSHVSEQNVILVYAREGRHVEWGIHRCLLQPAVRAEVEEFRGDALLGLAQASDETFVFIVRPAYREWARTREWHYFEVGVRFLTPAEFTAVAGAHTLIWP